MADDQIRLMELQIRASEKRSYTATDNSQDFMTDAIAASQLASQAAAKVAELNMVINQQRMEFNSINIDNLVNRHQKDMSRIDSRISELDATTQSFEEFKEDPEARFNQEEQQAEDPMQEIREGVAKEKEELLQQRAKLEQEFQAQFKVLQDRQIFLRSQVDSLKSNAVNQATIVEQAGQLSDTSRVQSLQQNDYAGEANAKTDELVSKKNEIIGETDTAIEPKVS